MPVSWQVRFFVSSATAMLATIVPSICCARALVSERDEPLESPLHVAGQDLHRADVEVLRDFLDHLQIDPHVPCL